MNREIKFRAWCTHWKIWGEVDFDVFLENTDSNQKGILEVTHHGKIILMQYTGLKDKDGKEIFEGDIVHSEVGFSGQVIFHHGCFGIKGGAGISMLWMNEPLTVIGNIYENPDLLV